MNDSRAILICDDEGVHASLIRWYLIRRGVGNPIRHFTRGKQLLDYLLQSGDATSPASQRTALILLDIRMPEMDGKEVLKAIKESPELQQIPVVMLTTQDDPDDIRMCQQLGSASYLTKPINDEVLVAVVRQHLEPKNDFVNAYIGEGRPEKSAIEF